MNEKDLLKKIKKESERRVPDVYDKTVTAARAQGLMDGGNTEVYSDGETVALGGVNKKAVAITMLAAFAAISLSIGLPFAFSGKPDSGITLPPVIPPVGDVVDDKVVAEIDIGDTYTYGAVTTARLAESYLAKTEGAKAMAKRAVSVDEFQSFGTYFTALDCFLGKGKLTRGNALVDNHYQKSVTISGIRADEEEYSYTLRYTEYKIVEKDYVSGDPVNYKLEGLLGSLSLTGTRTLASDAEGAEETALDLCAYPDLQDKTTYVQMQLQSVEIDGVTVKGYSYKIVNNNATVSEAVAYKPNDADLVINIKEGEADKGNFTISGEGNKYTGYKVDYVLGAEEGYFNIKYYDDGFKYELPTLDEIYSFLRYKDNGDDTYSISGYDKTATLPEELITPTTHNDKPVVKIDSYAFEKSPFKKIVISEGITKIDSYAFDDCKTLEEVEFPSTLTDIYSDAFRKCTNLKELNLPSTLTYIGSNAFQECTGLKALNLPSSLERIGSSAFYRCTNLEQVNLPSSLKKIESQTFKECKKLTEVTIPEGVEQIDSDVFDECTGLKTVKLPSSLKKLGYDIFTQCPNMESLTVASGNAVYHSAGNCVIDTAKKTVVAGCAASVIPADGSVTKIGLRALEDVCLAELKLPSCVTEIGEMAFADNLFTSLTLPEGLKIIGHGAFGGCAQLSSVKLPQSLESIGDGAFGDCASLSSVRIPKNVKSIGNGAFSYCDALETLTVDAGNPVYHSAGNCIIETNNWFLVAACKTSVIPSDYSVTVILQGALSFRAETITIPKTITKIYEWQSSFSKDSIETIIYGGTMAEFKALFAHGWNDDESRDFTAICKDGTIESTFGHY